MEIVTSWMEKGREEGKHIEAQSLVLRQLRKRLGTLEPDMEARIAELPVEKLEELAEGLLDFTELSDATNWLDSHRPGA